MRSHITDAPRVEAVGPSELPESTSSEMHAHQLIAMLPTTSMIDREYTITAGFDHRHTLLDIHRDRLLAPYGTHMGGRHQYLEVVIAGRADTDDIRGFMAWHVAIIRVDQRDLPDLRTPLQCDR